MGQHRKLTILLFYFLGATFFFTGCQDLVTPTVEENPDVLLSRNGPPIRGSSTSGPGANDGGGGTPGTNPYYSFEKDLYGPENSCGTNNYFNFLEISGDAGLYVKIISVESEDYNVRDFEVVPISASPTNKPGWYRINHNIITGLAILPHISNRPEVLGSTTMYVTVAVKESLDNPFENTHVLKLTQFGVCPRNGGPTPVW